MEEESGVLFSSNESGEYMPHGVTVSFTIQGLRDALTAAESTVTEPPHPMDEFIIQLEVTMVDQPRRPHPLAFSWNRGMVQHVLKSDLALRELEHIQVNSPGLAYLFFYDRHGCHGLTKEVALAICSHIADAFAEWIGRSVHFDAVPLLLEEGHQCVTAAQERHRQCIRTQEQPSLPIHVTGSGNSRSSQLVGRVPPVPKAQDGTSEQETPSVSVGKLRRCLMKVRPAPRGGGEDHHPPHLNILEEQIQITTQQPVSPVEATGIGDASRWKEDWHQQD